MDFWNMQAQVMLSDIYPGRAPKMGSTYWDQIHEVAVISVTRRVLKRLHEFLEQVIFWSSHILDYELFLAVKCFKSPHMQSVVVRTLWMNMAKTPNKSCRLLRKIFFPTKSNLLPILFHPTHLSSELDVRGFWTVLFGEL